MLPVVYIVITSFNNYNDILECIEELNKSNYDNYKVVIVNNGSNDSRYESIPTKFKNCTYINIKKNLGFSGGNNVGIKYSLHQGADYILLLSDDVVVGKDCLITLVEAMNKNPDSGIVGGKQYFYTPENLFYAAGGKINYFTGTVSGHGYKKLDRKQYDKIRSVDYIPMCSVLIKKDVFKKIGLLPDCYFLGGEEADFAYRAKKSGFDVLYTPKSICHHKVGYSSIQSLEYIYNRYRNRLLFISRNFKGFKKSIRILYFVFRNIIIEKGLSIIRKEIFRDQKKRLASIAIEDNVKYSEIRIEHLKNAFLKLDCLD